MDWDDLKDIVKQTFYIAVVCGVFAALYLFLSWLDTVQPK